MENINITKTLAKNRIIYKTHWNEGYEVILLITFLTPFIYLIINSFVNTNPFSQHIYLDVIFLLIITIMVSYAFYKNKKHRQLITLNTELNKETCKQLLYNFAINKNYELSFKGDNYFCFISRFNIFKRRKELTVIFLEDKILINIANSTGRYRYPAYFAPQAFAKELNKIIVNKSTEQTLKHG